MSESFEVYLSAALNDVSQPFHTFLGEKGVYTVQALRARDLGRSVWNAWSGQVTDCKAPNDCKTGWLNTFRIWCPAFTTPNQSMVVGDQKRWQHGEEAIQAARPVTFSLVRPAIVTLFIADVYNDNIGGMTIRVDRTDPPAPKS